MAIIVTQRGEHSPFEVRTVKCAQCGTERKEANHWFVLEVIEGEFIAMPLPDRQLLMTEQPVCGQQCAQKKFEQYMQTGEI